MEASRGPWPGMPVAASWEEKGYWYLSGRGATAVCFVKRTTVCWIGGIREQRVDLPEPPHRACPQTWLVAEGGGTCTPGCRVADRVDSLTGTVRSWTEKVLLYCGLSSCLVLGRGESPGSCRILVAVSETRGHLLELGWCMSSYTCYTAEYEPWGFSLKLRFVVNIFE